MGAPSCRKWFIHSFFDGQNNNPQVWQVSCLLTAQSMAMAAMAQPIPPIKRIPSFSPSFTMAGNSPWKWRFDHGKIMGRRWDKHSFFGLLGFVSGFHGLDWPKDVWCKLRGPQLCSFVEFFHPLLDIFLGYIHFWRMAHLIRWAAKDCDLTKPY